MNKNITMKWQRKLEAGMPKMERQRKTKDQYLYSKQDAEELKISATFDENRLVFVTTGRWISLNFIITQSHMTHLPIVEIIKNKVRAAIKDVKIWFEAYEIELRYNSRLDDHNCVMMPKYFTDAIKLCHAKDNRNKLIVDKDKNRIVSFEGLMKDDDKNRGVGTHIIPDQTLKHNTYILTYRKIS